MTSSNGNLFRVVYWPFVRGVHRLQWRGALMFSFICAWTNGWANNGDAGDLRRHCAHYDVTVMKKKSKQIKFVSVSDACWWVTRVKCMTWKVLIAVWLRDICSYTASLIDGLQECVSENTRVHQSFTPDNAHIEASQTLKVNGRFSAARMSERRRDCHGNK